MGINYNWFLFSTEKLNLNEKKQVNNLKRKLASVKVKQNFQNLNEEKNR